MFDDHEFFRMNTGVKVLGECTWQYCYSDVSLSEVSYLLDKDDEI